jgi:tartrate dehydrogenase/decarboxylase/D-malate dehydrogenase
LASVTKSNAQKYSMVFWDEVTQKLAAEYPDVEVSSYHIDAMAARMVMAPESLDVVVASNLFGDILTDLGAAIQGGLGFAASANINPNRTAPSMFEPVHGSAPDIAHLGIANPIAAIWSGAMMLEHLGEKAATAAIMAAIERTTAGGVGTIPGKDRTEAITAAILAQL